MRSLLGFVVIMLLSVGGLVGVGVGLGVLLHGLVPAIDLGVGTLIGVVAFGLCLQFVGRLLLFSDQGPAAAAAETLIRSSGHRLTMLRTKSLPLLMITALASRAA